MVGGSSAGANISAVLSHMARDNGFSPPLTAVYLNIPATCAPEVLETRFGPEYTSYKQNANAPVLDVKAVKWFHGEMTPHQSPLHIRLDADICRTLQT